MKLSKEQITFIDTYLKEKEVKYWDIRLEIIDHIATKLEENTDLVLDKDFLFQELGPYYAIKKIVNQKVKSIHKKYRKLFLKEIGNFFRSIKNITISLLLIFIYYLLYKETNPVFFKRMSLILYASIILVQCIYMFINFIRKNRSINLHYAMFYFMFSFFLFNMIIQLSNPKGIFEVSPHTQGITLLISTPIFLILAYCGYRVYYKTYQEYTHLFNVLKSI